MKKIYLLFSFLIAITSFSQICDVGNKNLTGNSRIEENHLMGVKISVTKQSTLRSLNLIGRNTGSGVQMALYSDNNGVPNNLIAQSGLETVTSDVNSLTVTPTLLSPGDYWIMAVYQSAGEHTSNSINTNNMIFYTKLNYGEAIPTNASSFPNYSGADVNYFLGLDCGDTLSTSDFKLKKISLYPNPAGDFIRINGIDKVANFEIYNTLGVLVKKGSVNTKEQINIEKLTSGVYVLKIENKESFKFIKN